MSEPGDASPERVIRITREELMDGHVEDLLKRQISMRGESGITRNKRGAWYYRNWFVFMLAGALGAFVAWAVMEPFFDDMHYLQGVIEAADMTTTDGPRIERGGESNRLDIPVSGWVRINGQQVWIYQRTLQLVGHRHPPLVAPELLRPGRSVGVYVEYVAAVSPALALSRFIEFDPPPQSASRAAMTLPQLAARHEAAGMLLFPLVAGLIGLVVGAADGIVCRLFRRALVGGGMGLLIGFIGGFVCSIVAGLVYTPISHLALRQVSPDVSSLSTFGFLVQMTGRSLAWCIAGMAMGLGQGIATRSKRILLFGFIGGIVGGLLGGLLFDPIDLVLLGPDKPSAHVSRCVGFTLIGAMVGLMIGLVELLARDTWLRMTEGPLAGKEFLVFKDVMTIGSSPRSEIYLFNDAAAVERHAVLRTLGEDCEIESVEPSAPVLINDHAVQRTRLRDGDRITVGKTSFVFQKRAG